MAESEWHRIMYGRILLWFVHTCPEIAVKKQGSLCTDYGMECEENEYKDENGNIWRVV